MKFYNIMTCEGFGTEFLGGCSMAWLGLVILFFFNAIIRKLCEEMDIPFEFWWALGGGILADVITIGFSGSFKIALFVGILFSLGVGFGMSYLTGGSGDSS